MHGRWLGVVGHLTDEEDANRLVRASAAVSAVVESRPWEGLA
jgi:hypothetical protein